MHRVPLEAQGPTGKRLSALLLGRPRATLQSIFVHPGVIDVDFTGQIYVMVSTPSLPVTIPEKTRIAQLSLFKSWLPSTDSKERGDQGFRLTGHPEVFWTQIIGNDRPITQCTVTMPKAKPSQIEIKGLVDPGSDVTIIAAYKWPLSRPTTFPESTIAGIGGTTQSYLSNNPVLIKVIKDKQPQFSHT